jgi:N-glycosylase/DNA lyase
MVEKMCTLFGKHICTINNQKYYSFPELENLAKPHVETKLRDSGFGYRAPYVVGTAKKILEKGGEHWLQKLSELEYTDAKQELMTLPGIGAKVKMFETINI